MKHVIIDGNNLLHAMHACAPLPDVGRETLVRLIERWAAQGDDSVTLVFDGAAPGGALAAQMNSNRINVRFSIGATADDLIVEMVHRANDPPTVRVVSSDKAIRHEARGRRCMHITAEDFVAELFPDPRSSEPVPRVADEKPDKVTPSETEDWLQTFGYDKNDTEPFDGHDAMTG